jgi:hypothetical protein
VKAAPLFAPAAWVVTASWLAEPGLTVNDVDVTDRAGEATANDRV